MPRLRVPGSIFNRPGGFPGDETPFPGPAVSGGSRSSLNANRLWLAPLLLRGGEKAAKVEIEPEPQRLFWEGRAARPDPLPQPHWGLTGPRRPEPVGTVASSAGSSQRDPVPQRVGGSSPGKHLPKGDTFWRYHSHARVVLVAKNSFCLLNG